MKSPYDHIESLLLSGNLSSIELGLHLAQSQQLSIQPLLDEMAIMVNFLVAHCDETIVYQQLSDIPAILAGIDEIKVDYSRIKANHQNDKGYSPMQIPDKLQYLPNLRSIQLVNVGLRYLPPSVVYCRKLKKLNLRENELWELPDGLEQLPLEEVKLGSNPMPALSSSITHNPTIKQLYLNDCGITDLDESLGKMSALRILALSGNPLQQLPNSIGQLRHLRVLNLYNAQLIELPYTLGQLKQLQVLNLTNNRLRRLPDSFGGLQSLQALGLTGNVIPELPESVAELEQLADLSVDCIPDFLERIPALENLHCNWSMHMQKDWCQRIVKLSSLKGIVLSNMSVTPITPFELQLNFEDLAGLKRFRSFNLPLTGLPDTIQALKGLECFDATGTELEDLRFWRKRLKTWLPDTAIHLTSNRDPDESDILIVH